MNEYSVMLTTTSRHPYLIKDREVKYQEVKDMSNPNKIADMMNTVYGLEGLAEEHLFMIAMNSKCDATGVFQIGHGTVDLCCASARDIFTRALLSGASRIVLAHNHPSGNLIPSNMDIRTTKQIATAGAMLDVELLDHIIVGDGKLVSMKEDYPDVFKPAEIEV